MGIWILISLVVCLFPSLGQAEDVKQTILLLPDTEAECRYVASLVANARNQVQGADRLKEKSEQAEAAGDLRLAATTMTSASNMLLDATSNSWGAIFEATNTIEIKRGALSPCAARLKEEGQQGMKAALDKNRLYGERLTYLTGRLKGR